MISKTTRQLAIFHIFFYSEVVELIEITNLIKISHKTITRDLKELQNAGLINIKFSKKEKGYIHIDNDNPCPFASPIFSENKAIRMHIEKLIRLATIMIGLRYHTELSYDDDNSVDQETCSSWYRNRFPNLSIRTMQRDFAGLNEIGYSIEYDYFDRCYIVDFPEGLDGLQYKLQYKLGV